MIIVYYHPFNTPLDPQVCGSAWPAGLGTSAAVRVERNLPVAVVAPEEMGMWRRETWGFLGHWNGDVIEILIDLSDENGGVHWKRTTGISPSNTEI